MKFTLPCSLAAALLATFTLASCGGSETPDKADTSAADSAVNAADQVADQVDDQVAKGKTAAADKMDNLKEKAGVVVSDAKAAAAKQLFSTYCSTCHGTEGKGDGPAAVALEPKPASFGDLAWQDSVTDEHLLKVLREGGAAAGKSPLMVAAPGAKDDPELAQALLNIVRSYRP